MFSCVLGGRGTLGCVLGFATVQGGMCFPGLHCSGSKLLYKALLQMGAVFRALPASRSERSKPLRFSGAPQGTDQDELSALCPSQVCAAQASRCLVSELFPAGHASESPAWPGPLSSWVYCQSRVPRVPCISYGKLISVTLLADVNHTGSQEDMVGNRKPAHSLVENVVSGAKIAAAPCLQALAIPCPLFCLWRGRALIQ